MTALAPLPRLWRATTRTTVGRSLLMSLAVAGSCAWLGAAMLAFPREPVSGAVVAVLPALCVLLVTVPWSRMAVVVVGGLLVLGGADSVGPLKVLYAGVVLVAVALSMTALLRSRAPWLRQFRFLLVPGLVFGVLLLVGAVVSPLGWQPVEVTRGSIYWMLIIAAPMLGLDAARGLRPATAHRVVGIGGLIAAVGFATHWLDARGVSALAFGNWLLPSLVIPAVAFALAFTQAGLNRGRRRVLWALLASGILIAMLVSGTRTNLLIVAAVLGTLGARRLSRVPVGRAVTTLGLIAGSVLLCVPVLVTTLIANPGFFATRVQALTSVFSGGLGDDSSFLMRQDQQAVALRIIGENPLFGYGVGWVLNHSLDTTWITVVRIGFVGLAGLLLFLGCCAFAITRSALRGRSSPGHTTASGSAAFFAVLLVLASPADDHGFGFALAMIFLLVGVHVRTAGSTRRADASSARAPLEPSPPRFAVHREHTARLPTVVPAAPRGG